MASGSFDIERFERLKEQVVRHERIAGIYILDAALVPKSSNKSRDQFLRDFAAGFGFRGPDVGDSEWKHNEVFREEAQKSLTETLMGGGEIGHSRWDVPPQDARKLVEEFLNLFGDDARFFCNCVPPSHDAQVLAPYGYPNFDDFIFGGGCIAIDQRGAAIFWMLDND